MLNYSIKQNKFFFNSRIKKNIFSESIWSNFWKIFFVFFFSMFTIVFHNLIPLSIEYIKNYNVSGGIVSQSIGYTQPIIFFSITIIVMISIQILSISKKNYKDKNIIHYKNIINTGLSTLLSAILSISILFITTMFLYSKVVINNLTIISKDTISIFIEQYSSMMIPNLFFIGVSIYLIFILMEHKFNLKILITGEILFSLLNISLSTIFLYFTDLSPTISLPLASLIINMIKLLTILFLFYYYVANWKIYDFSFDKEIFFEIWKTIFALSFYMFVYSITMLIQMILITMINSPNLDYLYTKNGEYLIILARIIVYSIINLLITIPRSMGRAINLYYEKPELDLKKAEKQFKNSFDYALKISIVFFIIGICILSFIIFLVDGLFLKQNWSHEVIPTNIANQIPFPHFENVTFLDIIKKFVFEGFFISLVSQVFLGLSINIRVAIFFNFKRELKLFWLILFCFLVIQSLGSFLLGTHLQRELPGLIGFVLAQLINSIAALCITIIGIFYTKNKLINDILKSKNKEQLKPIYKFKSIKKYKEIRKEKIKICLGKN